MRKQEDVETLLLTAHSGEEKNVFQKILFLPYDYRHETVSASQKFILALVFFQPWKKTPQRLDVFG